MDEEEKTQESRDQRATITSMPRFSNSARSASVMPSSVMKPPIRSIGPSDENEVRPILELSATRYTFEAALIMARRRRFGPFAVQPVDRPAREKHLAAMLRAGHPLDIARRIVDATDPDETEEWVESAFGDE